MTIKEKLNLTSDRKEICLFKEGAFWIAYEQSCYMVSQLKPLKLTKKLVKTTGGEVVSAGFPDSALEKIVLQGEVVERNETFLALNTAQAVDKEVFEAWKSNIPLRIPPAGKEIEPKALTLTDTLIEQLRKFNLSNATPIACMVFLSELKNLVQ